MNWLARLLTGPQHPIVCPRCQTHGAEDRGPVVKPYADGASTVAGRLYGCPHCGLGYFVQDGALRVFGHLKGTFAGHPAAWAPPPEALEAAAANAREREREPIPRRDTDQPWR